MDVIPTVIPKTTADIQNRQIQILTLFAADAVRVQPGQWAPGAALAFLVQWVPGAALELRAPRGIPAPGVFPAPRVFPDPRVFPGPRVFQGQPEPWDRKAMWDRLALWD